MNQLKNKISPIYQNLLPTELLEIEFPKERFATCLSCQHEKDKKNYRYQTKCCDYHPTYPNYVVGAILSDEDPALKIGQERFRAKIANRLGVTPNGIYAPKSYTKKFGASRERNRTIPQSEINEIVCPYYTEDRLCSVWKYRSELCATYHCISSNGQQGHQFWTIMRTYLTTIEHKLSIYAIQQMKYPKRLIQTRFTGRNPFQMENKEDELNEERYKNIWRKWAGKEAAFYIECFRVINELDPEKVSQLMGVEEQILIEQLQEQAEKMKLAIIPDRLQLNMEHPKYATLQTTNKIQLSNGQNLTIRPIQNMLLKSFKKPSDTLPVVQKALIMKMGLSGILLPLLQEGVLEEA